MRNLRIVVIICAVASVATFFACSKNNPAGPNSGPTFAFAVGDTFHFSQWKLDANSNKIPATHELVKEIIVANNLMIDGQTGAVMAVDTTTDTTGRFITSDTVYYYTNGNSISVYGLIAKYIYQYASISIAPKWNMMIDQGNTAGWVTDTTTATIQSITGQESTNGKDTGAANIAVNTTTLLADHAVHHGTISVPSLNVTVPITINVYASYDPTIIVRSVASPANYLGNPVDGLELDLDSYAKVTK